MFLRIVNPTVCPVEGFTVLGVSTSTGESELIGQFGSGNKHAVNVCLRNAINPIIYCGLTRVEFFTQPERMGDKVFSRVYCKISNRKPERLSIAAEYGEQDWTGVDMALREFVSNAIDAAGGTTKGVKIDVVNKITARKDKTVVGIPLTPEVQRWFQALPVMFLHFDKKSKEKLGKKILRKKSPNRGCIYRKGVLVRTLDDTIPSLFDYNFGDELPIDEARKLDNYRIQTSAADSLGQSEHLEEIFRQLPLEIPFWERGLPEWNLCWIAQHKAASWQKAWKNVHGDGVLSFGVTPLADMAEKQGHKTVCIQDANWHKALCSAGIRQVFDVLSNVNGKGHVFKDPTPEAQATLDQVWSWIGLVDLHNGKEKPKLKLFERVLQAGESLRGYAMGDTVYVHLEDETNHQTYLEEIAHYVTGSGDMSRDFQDYAFRLATKLALYVGG